MQNARKRKIGLILDREICVETQWRLQQTRSTRRAYGMGVVEKTEKKKNAWRRRVG